MLHGDDLLKEIQMVMAKWVFRCRQRRKVRRIKIKDVIRHRQKGLNNKGMIEKVTIAGRRCRDASPAAFTMTIIR